MSSLITYKTINGGAVKEVSPDPVADAGLALNTNFRAIADSLPRNNYGASTDPTPDNDSVDTAGIGVDFNQGSRWYNGTTIFECVDATPGAAVWVSANAGGPFVPTSGGTITASGASAVPLTIKAAASQTANLLNVEDSSAGVMSWFGSDGNLFVNGTNAGGGNLRVGYNVSLQQGGGSAGLFFDNGTPGSTLLIRSNGSSTSNIQFAAGASGGFTIYGNGDLSLSNSVVATIGITNSIGIAQGGANGLLFFNNGTPGSEFVVSTAGASTTSRLRLETHGGSIVLEGDGSTGMGGNTSPTAGLHLGAGTSSRAPFKLTAGGNLTTPADGALEYDGTHLYFTIGSTRQLIV